MKIDAINVPDKGQIEVIKSESPSIESPTDVKVRMKVTGICGSDMHFYHGTLPEIGRASCRERVSSPV